MSQSDLSPKTNPGTNDASDEPEATAVASSELPSADEVAERDFNTHRIRPSFWTISIGVVLLASFGVWAYAYSGAADRPPPDVLETQTGEALEAAPDLLDTPDREGTDPETNNSGVGAFAREAEPICTVALEDLEQLPDASLAETAAERSVDLRSATDRLGVMLDDLEEINVANESSRDAEIRAEWLTNWRVYIEDRYRFADALIVDEDARFLVSDIGVSESPERRLSRFATVNGMESCGTPGDVG